MCSGTLLVHLNWRVLETPRRTAPPLLSVKPKQSWVHLSSLHIVFHNSAFLLSTHYLSFLLAFQCRLLTGSMQFCTMWCSNAFCNAVQIIAAGSALLKCISHKSAEVSWRGWRGEWGQWVRTQEVGLQNNLCWIGHILSQRKTRRGWNTNLCLDSYHVVRKYVRIVQCHAGRMMPEIITWWVIFETYWAWDFKLEIIQGVENHWLCIFSQRLEGATVISWKYFRCKYIQALKKR